MHDLVGMLAIALSIGGPVAIGIVALVTRYRRQKLQLEQQAQILAQMIEKSGSADIDMKAIASAFQPQIQKSIKASILGNLRAGLILGLLGIGFLIFGDLIMCNPTLMGNEGETGDAAGMLITGGIILAIGLALVISFFVSKRYLKKEIAVEEKKLDEALAPKTAEPTA